MTGIVFVCNKNPEAHVDMYDGQEFVFPPGVKVPVPKDAAVHMFAVGLKDKETALVRLGLAWKYDPATKKMVENPDAGRWLANFVVTEAVLVDREAVPDGTFELA